MDPITHGLAGVVIRNVGFRRKAALGVLVLASLAPDIDHITRIFGADVFLRYHRGVTHSVFILFIIPVIFSLFFGFKKRVFYYSFLFFLGYGLHILLDLTNQYSVRLFSPLDSRRYSADLTFIIDPYVSIGFLVSIVFSRLNRKKAGTIALATFILLMSYMGTRYYFHEKTEDFLRSKLDNYICKLCPLPNDFLRWWFVARLDGITRVGFADLFTQRVYVQETYVQGDDPAIEHSKKDEIVKSFLDFAKYPYASVRRLKTEGGTAMNANEKGAIDPEKGRIEVIWRELAYSFLPGEHFRARVVMDENGKILSSSFKF